MPRLAKSRYSQPYSQEAAAMQPRATSTVEACYHIAIIGHMKQKPYLPKTQNMTDRGRLSHLGGEVVEAFSLSWNPPETAVAIASVMLYKKAAGYSYIGHRANNALLN